MQTFKMPKTLVLGQLFVTLLFPTTLWANACSKADTLVSQAYYLNNNPVKQKSVLQQALRLCPSHAKAHNNLGVILESEQNYTDALYHYRQVLNSPAKEIHTKAWVGIGDVYFKQGQLPLSLEAYLQVCTHHPRARQRVTELMRDNRYRTVEANQVMKRDSLALLYDKPRLQQLYQLANQCQYQFFKSFSTKTTKGMVTKAILDPVVIYRNLFFKTGKHDLSLISGEQLDEIALTLINNKGKINVSGHADAQRWANKSLKESKRLNVKLSKNRANSVKIALMQLGISKSRIKVYGYGDNQPLVQGNNKNAWAKNRRVEIEMSD
ncbi:OmpA family protein [Candidatus Parabeggiatoa sp. HSG14]|uniref:OmpA family protein n=1 Tax=Candidatus Parabeggiatoa sp. HSG14 TaxID=3055593 RepID=UPI0025A7FACD|nr:OmpA family protein [Thiotrichales bacterium HSG14]